MDLDQYVRVLRARWLLVVLGVLVCTAAAGVLAWTRTSIYAAETQLFVSTSGVPADLSQTYQGGLFSQQRVRSYAKVMSSAAVAQAVIKELRLSQSTQDVQEKIRASVPTDSVLINVTVKDRSPRLAKAIADSVGHQFPRLVTTLERPQRGEDSPVKVTVTSPARLPSDPVSPQKPVYLALGALFGLSLGIGGAALREALDKRIRDDENWMYEARAPVLGRIVEDPDADARPLVSVSDPFSAAAEEYRRLRTNLRVLGVDHRIRSFVVTSAVTSEGKTLVVANLGAAFATAGQRVVLVDADLRRPKLAEVLGLDSNVGLTNVLVDDLALDDALRRPKGLALDFLASGPLPPNPTELLQSSGFESLHRALTERFEVVILDAPALLPVTDAAILAGLASAGVILVTRVGSTRTDQIETATQSLHTVDERVLGVVLNGLPVGHRRPYGSAVPASRDD